MGVQGDISYRLCRAVARDRLLLPFPGTTLLTGSLPIIDVHFCTPCFQMIVHRIVWFDLTARWRRTCAMQPRPTKFLQGFARGERPDRAEIRGVVKYRCRAAVI